MGLFSQVCGWRCRSLNGHLLIALAAASAFALSGRPAKAQQIDFSVDNVSVEQVVSGEQTTTMDDMTLAGLSDRKITGTLSFILQSGQDNYAYSSITRSDRAVSATIQSGSANTSVGLIDNSPGSAIAQIQIGSDNTSAAAIVGGNNNSIGIAQIGSDLGAYVGLVNSRDTQVSYGQAGQDYTGGIVIKNAPPGTRIKLN